MGQRWRRLPITAQDTVLAGAWMLAFLFMGAIGPWGWSSGAPWTTLMELLTCLPLVVRRRYPLKVALTLGALMLLTLGISTDVHPLALALIAYAAGSAAFHGTPMPVLVPLSAGWFLLFFHAVGRGGLSPEPPGQLVMLGVMGALPAIIGYLLRLRAERTEQRLRATRARAQQERARERARIARDVHDIAGHHLSSIRLLAVGGRESLKGPDADPDAVLASIADASGRAVREVRELLDLLRSERLDEPAPADVRLDDIPLLVSALDGSGVEVDLVVPYGVSNGVPARVEADAYRIVQESLGNVLRHSSARHAVVRLARRNGESGVVRQLVVTVEDDGSALPEDDVPESTGMGLRGMRERAEELGGSLEAGFRRGSGWRVRAFLPLVGGRQGAEDEEADRTGPGGSDPGVRGEVRDESGDRT